MLIFVRRFSREILIKVGEVFGEVFEGSEKKIVFIVSVDYGYVYDENGFYGYRKESEEYDRFIMELINESCFEEFLEILDELIEKVLFDSYW